MKEKLGKEYEKDDNIVISQIVYECFKWKSIMYVVEGNKIINNIKKRYKFKHARKDKYKDGFPNNEIDINIDDIEENKLFVNVDDNKFDDIMDMLLLYKLLKNERNDFNHMLEKNTKADKQTAAVNNAILSFLQFPYTVLVYYCSFCCRFRPQVQLLYFSLFFSKFKIRNRIKIP